MQEQRSKFHAVSISDTVWRWLRDRAYREERSMANIVEEILQDTKGHEEGMARVMTYYEAEKIRDGVPAGRRL